MRFFGLLKGLGREFPGGAGSSPLLSLVVGTLAHAVLSFLQETQRFAFADQCCCPHWHVHATSTNWPLLLYMVGVVVVAVVGGVDAEFVGFCVVRGGALSLPAGLGKTTCLAIAEQDFSSNMSFLLSCLMSLS